MKIDCGSLEYALARLQARHGRRPGEADWRGIETLRGLPQALEQARRSSLRPWLAGITAESSPAQTEAMLRARWRATVGEIEDWLPPPWQLAMAWCATLPDLGPLQHLARGGEPAAWMQDDAAWREMAAAEVPARAGVLAGGRWAALVPAWKAPGTLGTAWLAEWRRLLPGPPAVLGEAMPRLAALLREHLGAFAAAPAGQGGLLRSALRARLAMLLRQAGIEPAAMFIQLALTALDFERLRGELLRRAWFARQRVA